MRPDDVYPLTEDKQCWSAVTASKGKQSRSVNKSTEIPLDVLGSKSSLNSSVQNFHFRRRHPLNYFIRLRNFASSPPIIR
jgi:hypothetical protein